MIKDCSCFAHNPVVEVRNIAENGVSVVAVFSPADNSQQLKNPWSNFMHQWRATVSVTSTHPIFTSRTKQGLLLQVRQPLIRSQVFAEFYLHLKPVNAFFAWGNSQKLIKLLKLARENWSAILVIGVREENGPPSSECCLFCRKMRAGCNWWWRKTQWCKYVQVHLLTKTQYHDVAGTRGIFIIFWMPNNAFHSKHLLEGMIILNIRQNNDY